MSATPVLVIREVYHEQDWTQTQPSCSGRVPGKSPNLSHDGAVQESDAEAKCLGRIPLCASRKDWHGMRRYRLRRLWRGNCEALVRATGQNLKRLLKKRGWGRHPWPEGADMHSETFFQVGNAASSPVLSLCLVRSKLNKGFFNRLTSYMYSMYVSHRRDEATFCLLNTSV